MVKEGIYKVELVNAVTNQAFQEHVGPDGNVYAEVEPDTDYFVRVSVEGSADNPVCFTFVVDGQLMDYSAGNKNGVVRGGRFGDFARENGTDTRRALRFQKIKATHQSSRKKDGVLDEKGFGSVEVHFWELLRPFSDDRPPPELTVQSRWTHGNTDLITAMMSETKIKDDKILMTGLGNTTLTYESFSLLHWRRGKHIGCLKIRYCTTVGLILAGILPKPPGWEWRHHAEPGKAYSISTIKCLAVEPESIVLIHENAALGQKEVTVDLYDLVEADESDEEEEDAGATDSHDDDTTVKN